MGNSIHKKTTIYDIAEACGTSPATVSRVLSGSSYPVKQEVRERILETAKRLNYIPNLAGKQLKSVQNNDIGVVIPNMSNYYSTLIHGIQDVTLKHNSQMILCNSYRDAKIEAQHVHLLLQKQVKGILIASIDESGGVLQQIIDSGTAVVAMEQDVRVDCNRTRFNFAEGAEMAMAHLLELGHSRIGFVTSPLSRASRRNLLAGYRQSLSAQGLTIDERYIYTEPEEDDSDELYDFTVGQKAVDHFLAMEQPPTALFCINDMMAVGVTKRLKSLGKNVPDDMSVVGFDNIPLTQMVTPAMTTIDQSTYELGNLSADLLFKTMSDAQPSSSPNVTLHLEPRLVVRESTARPSQRT
ncbi:LacI family DNA-binding transcriptional regulator [Paenibacillaceae bacterium WGS1546]|uniref:LacI family DNA-binding transcriptional regulator n=1 Tax=Cohnella sp. WGS1546 TaxID=3366810 RepID=UPI00372D6C0E